MAVTVESYPEHRRNIPQRPICIRRTVVSTELIRVTNCVRRGVNYE
jgi:hypothetical protein